MDLVSCPVKISARGLSLCHRSKQALVLFAIFEIYVALLRDILNHIFDFHDPRARAHPCKDSQSKLRVLRD